MRVFLPYELNHLARYNFPRDEASLLAYGTQPVEYITGRVIFKELELDITPDALIPRIETEELIEHITDEVHHAYTTFSPTIVEIGTGSGAIILSLARALNSSPNRSPQLPQPTLIASDISEPALQIAQHNYQKLQTKHNLAKISWYKGSLLEALPLSTKIDVLVANLPYIPTARLKTLDPSVIDHEPLTALDGGSDGMKLITNLLTTASAYLNPGATIWLEVDDTHTQHVWEQFAPQFTVELYLDQFQKNRFAKLRLKSS